MITDTDKVHQGALFGQMDRLFLGFDIDISVIPILETIGEIQGVTPI